MVDIPYNTEELDDSDCCPDPRLLLPDMLKHIGTVIRKRLCELEQDSHDYTDEEIGKLTSVLDALKTGFDDVTIERLKKISVLFNNIDKNSDGNFSELIKAISQVSQNTSQIGAVQSILTNYGREIGKLDLLDGRLRVLEVDNKTHEQRSKKIVCVSNTHLMQALSSGFDKFMSEMDMRCDEILNSSSGTSTIGKDKMSPKDYPSKKPVEMVGPDSGKSSVV